MFYRWCTVLCLTAMVFAVGYDVRLGASMAKRRQLDPPDWPYAISRKQAGTQSEPLQLELVDSSKTSIKRCLQAVVKPYVQQAKQDKQYLVRLPHYGKYFYPPNNHTEKEWAEKNNLVLQFLLVVCADGLEQVKHMTIFKQPPRQGNTFEGNFADLQYHVSIETRSGDRTLKHDQADVKWVEDNTFATHALWIDARASVAPPAAPAQAAPAAPRQKKPSPSKAPVADRSQTPQKPLAVAAPPKPAQDVLRVSLAGVPEAVFAKLRSRDDIAIKDLTINGQAAKLDSHFNAPDKMLTMTHPAGQVAAADWVAFNLHLPDLHPESIRVRVGEPSTDALQPTFKPVQTLHITLRDASGKPVPGLMVQIHDPGVEPRIFGKTNAKGHVSYVLPRDVHAVQWSFAGTAMYAPIPPRSIDFEPSSIGTKRDSAQLHNQRFQTVLQVEVIDDESGQPVPQAHVEVTWGQDARSVVLAETASGRYTSPSLPVAATPGFTYTVTARHFKTNIAPEPIGFKPETHPLTVRLEPNLIKRELEVAVTYREQGQEKYAKNARGWVTYQDQHTDSKRAPLVYKDGRYHATIAYLAGTQPSLEVQAGAQFVPYTGSIDGEGPVQVQLDYSKPFLYVYINPNDHLKRGPIRKSPNNFSRFKESFLYLIETLNTQEHWTHYFSNVFIYAVNRNQPPTPLLESGITKPNWRDRNFQRSILDPIQLGNSFVRYEEVVAFAATSLQGYRFAPDHPVHAVLLYVLGAPPTPIFDPDEELRSLESMLSEHKIVSVIAQFADNDSDQRQDFTKNTALFQHLRLLELNVAKEFEAGFFLGSMQHIEDVLTQLLNNKRLKVKG